MIKRSEQYSIGLWLVVALMLTTATLRFFQNINKPVVMAAVSRNSYFTIGACADGRVFGWGNRGVGTEITNQIGCFDTHGDTIEHVFNLESCRARACQ